MILGLLLLAAAQIGSREPARNETGTASPDSAVKRPSGDNFTVYLLTMGPGDQVWEKFGHNAIWIHDSNSGSDVVYHWGLFDFADKEFFPRFIQGRMRYSMGAFDMEQTVDQYRQANRTVWAQELNLAPAAREKLAEFVAWNLLPENRLYDYDYYRDNCSTRVRDALDNALGGVIRRASETAPAKSTYRFHTERLTQDDLPVYAGTMMGLGQPVDRPISIWDEMFLPVKMMERLRAVRVATSSGTRPLVVSERVLFQATRPAEAARVTRGIGGFLLSSVLVLLFGVAMWRTRWKSGRRRGLLALVLIWSVIAGLSGSLLFGLWALTDHVYSYRNENLLQMNPLSLLLAGLLSGTLWRLRRADRPEPRWTIALSIVIATMSVLGFLVQALPGFYQGNGGIIALAMPIHIGVALLLLQMRETGPGTRHPAAATRHT